MRDCRCRSVVIRHKRVPPCYFRRLFIRRSLHSCRGRTISSRQDVVYILARRVLVSLMPLWPCRVSLYTFRRFLAGSARCCPFWVFTEFSRFQTDDRILDQHNGSYRGWVKIKKTPFPKDRPTICHVFSDHFWEGGIPPHGPDAIFLLPMPIRP